MKTRVVVAAVIKKGNRFLFGQKEKNIGPYPNTWHLLGGGVKENEGFEDALKREVKEEAGIEITNIQPLLKQEDIEPNKENELTHYVFHVFSGEYQSGNLKPGSDIVKLQWIPKAKLKTISLNHPSKELFAKMGTI